MEEFRIGCNSKFRDCWKGLFQVSQAFGSLGVFQVFFIGSQRKTPPGWGGIQKFSNGSGFGYIMDGRGRKAMGFEFSNRIKEEEQTADFDDNFLVDYKNKSDCLQQQSTDGHQCQKSC